MTLPAIWNEMHTLTAVNCYYPMTQRIKVYFKQQITKSLRENGEKVKKNVYYKYYSVAY